MNPAVIKKGIAMAGNAALAISSLSKITPIKLPKLWAEIAPKT